MVRFVSVLIVLLVFSQCVVEKRVYSSGYHVSWNKQLRHSAPTEEITEDELAENEIKPTQKTDEELNVEPLNLESLEPLEYSPAGDQNLNVESLESFEPSSENFILAENPAASPDTVYFYPKFETNGIVSFACGVTAVATVFASAALGTTGLLFLAFLLLITGLILGISSLKRYESNPELYRANVFGVLGVIVNALGLGVMLIGLVALIVFILSF